MVRHVAPLRYSLLSSLLPVIPLIFNCSASKNDHRPSSKAGSKRQISWIFTCTSGLTDACRESGRRTWNFLVLRAQTRRPKWGGDIFIFEVLKRYIIPDIQQKFEAGQSRRQVSRSNEYRQRLEHGITWAPETTVQELLRSIFQRKINLFFLFLFAFTACCMLPCTTHWQSVERCMI